MHHSVLPHTAVVCSGCVPHCDPHAPALHAPIMGPSQLVPPCSRGVDFVRAEFIPDSKEEIQDSLMRLKQRVGPGGVVFTSGA